MPRGIYTDKNHMDITEPDTQVEVEVDLERGVLYVHMEGFSPVRICRIREVRITVGESPTDYLTGFGAPNGKE